ncbi:sensory neuron membrane protein 1-like isoform X2 [Chrysoperla carnea]|uniref:sensory neuron membrane protein 1-like isoform X2 n=1 Tax=Chrysoperla carnea TaxID=189513 RepID=UPI001D08D2CF|nr:sensory neuron membrane protein 1-like isoform X2 [Chrysoperla carnea]
MKLVMDLPIKIAIGSGAGLLFGILFGWAIFPALLHHKISSQVALKKGGEIREMIVKFPFSFDFKIYMFNITNPMDVQKGDTPVLDEVGPFFYDEWKEKVNVVDDDTDDTMTFNAQNTFYFNQEKSGKLTGDELITIPHPFIVGPAIAAKREKPAMLSLLNKAIASIYHAESIFLTARVRDILFDGIMIYCNVTDFAGKGFCSVMRNDVKDLVHVTDNVFSFSFFGPKNGTFDPRPTKMQRGIKNAKDVGRVLEFDGKPNISVWGKKDCDEFRGTDGTIFPPFLKEEDGLLSFSSDICRSLPANYVKDVVYKGIPARYYTATLGDMSKNKNEKCFCPTPDTCLKKGSMDLTKCLGAPLVITLPHFYDADESFLGPVRGLHPNVKDHGIYIYFEPMSGTPMEARKRLQFNIPLEKIDKIALMKELPEALVPIFWIEEGVALNDTFINQLKSQLVRTIKIVTIMKWVIILLSIVGIGVAGFLQFKKNTGFAVTPTYGGNNELKKTNNIISTISNADNRTSY